MINNINKLILLVMTLSFISISVPTLAETVNGEVASVDSDYETIMIRQGDAAGGSSTYVTAKVDSDAKILKNGTAISLSDIKKDEKVSIEFGKDEMGTSKVIKIDVK